MHYVCIDDLLDDVRVALKAHPSERERLKAIATTARRDGLEAGIAAFANWQNIIASGGKVELPQPAVDGAAEPREPQPAAPESARTRDDAPDNALRKATAQSAPGVIAAQTTLSGEADTGALPAEKLDVASQPSGASRSTPVHASQPDSPTWSVAPESTQTGAEPAGDTLPASASQSASVGTTAQGAQPGKANGQPDDAARLRAQIAGCLKMETDPALQLFLKQLASDAHKYPAEYVRQELDAYLQAANPDDFLHRLAALHWQWVQDDVAADSDGRLLTRGNAGERKTVLARIQANFDWEPQPVLRCYLAKLARQAVTDPVKAADGMESYLDGRTSPTWVWLAAVFVCGSPEAAFQWRLQEVRRRVTNARLLDYLDNLEQAARRNLPAAAEKLEALAEITALLDVQAAVA